MAHASAGHDPATGRRLRVKRVANTRSEALRRARAAADELRERGAVQPVGTVADLLERWIAAGAPSRQGRKGEAWLQATRTLTENHLLPTLGRYRLQELRPEHVEAMLAARTHLSRSTLRHLRGLLSQAFEWGVRRRSIRWNPVKSAIVPEVNEAKAERRALNDQETRALLEAADTHRLGAWVTVTLTLGLRPGECSALRWDDVDLEARVAVIRATKTGTTRVLRIPPTAVTALQRHRRRQAEERRYVADGWPAEHDDLVFRSETGTSLDRSNTRRIVQRLAADAGIEGNVTSYDLRHTAATRLSAAGVAPELLADLLGHKDTRMVFGHYRHPPTPVVETATVWETVLG